MLSLLRKSQVNPNQIALLDAADESSVQMSHIVNDVLDLTKIKRGNFQLEITKVDLHELLKKIDTMYSLSGQCSDSNDTSERKLKWSTHIDEDIPHALMGDPTRLMQIMSNLVSNAFKVLNASLSRPFSDTIVHLIVLQERIDPVQHFESQ